MSIPGLNWTIHQGESRALVTVNGELDLARCDPLETALLDTVGADRTVVLDLAGLRFIDSSGVRCLLNVRTAVEDAGGSLLLQQVSPAVERILDVTGTLPLFSFVDSDG